MSMSVDKIPSMPEKLLYFVWQAIRTSKILNDVLQICNIFYKDDYLVPNYEGMKEVYEDNLLEIFKIVKPYLEDSEDQAWKGFKSFCEFHPRLYEAEIKAEEEEQERKEAEKRKNREKEEAVRAKER